MKKRLASVLLALLLAAACMTAGAESSVFADILRNIDYGDEVTYVIGHKIPDADTVTGLAIETDPDHLESCAVCVRVSAYHEETETVTVEVITPERFDGNDIRSLSVGDSVFTDGKEVTVESVTEESAAPFGARTVLNKDTDPVWLIEDDQKNYRSFHNNDYVWLSVAALEIPLPDDVLFLDGANPESGGIPGLPLVKNKNDLIKVLREDEEDRDPGLDRNNAYAVFNEAGELAAVVRYDVPWR